MKFIKFLSSMTFNYKTPYYVGGFPEIENLGDVALYDSMNMLFNNKLNIYPGGRRYSFFSTFLKNNIGVLSGGTIINRHTLFAAKEGTDIFKEFFVLGTGVTQLSFWSKEDSFKDCSKEWKNILDKAKYVGVRGPDSVDELKRMGIESSCFGDPVIQMTKTNTFDFKAGTIGLNIGLSGGNVWGSELEIKNKYIELASLLKKRNLNIEWFVVCPEDLQITKEVANKTDTSQVIHKIYTNCEDYFEKASKLEAFVGLKLHAVMMAMCVHVPSIMFEYRPKCLDFMKSVGQQDNNFRTDELDIGLIMDKIDSLISKRTSISSEIKAKMLKIRKDQLEIVSSLM